MSIVLKIAGVAFERFRSKKILDSLDVQMKAEDEKNFIKINQELALMRKGVKEENLDKRNQIDVLSMPDGSLLGLSVLDALSSIYHHDPAIAKVVENAKMVSPQLVLLVNELETERSTMKFNSLADHLNHKLSTMKSGK